MSNKIVKVIPALDVTDLDRIKKLVSAVSNIDIIYGYKVGFSLGLKYGLPKVVETIREFSDKPIIYDHQKAGTDIPDTGQLFAETMDSAGVDEVILFPQAGPNTLHAWVSAVMERDLRVIVGGVMTHPGYLVSEGGFIRDEAVTEMYRMAYDQGVRSFVVPLTKPQAVLKLYEQAGLNNECEFYSPGFGKQGGDLKQFDFLKKHFLIIGRSLLQAEDPGEYLKDKFGKC